MYPASSFFSPELGSKSVRFFRIKMAALNLIILCNWGVKVKFDMIPIPFFSLFIVMKDGRRKGCIHMNRLRHQEMILGVSCPPDYHVADTMPHQSKIPALKSTNRYSII